METRKVLRHTERDGVPEVSPQDFQDFIGNVTLIDVRRPEEFHGELGHIPGAKIFTLGPDLDAFLGSYDKEGQVVFVCRSGARSGRATLQSLSLGISHSFNLQGGMLLWNRLNYPIARE